MATLEHENPPPPLPPGVRSRIAALRAGIYCYVLLEGIAAVAVWLGLWFWASMAIDWCFEPPRLVRAVLLAVAGLGLAAAVFSYILRRAFVRLSDRSMAMLLERRFPQFNDSLLTTVVLRNRPAEQTGFNPQMLSNTIGRAEQQVAGLRVSEVFDPMPLVRKIVIALGLAAIVGLLAWRAPGDLRIWTQRNLFLADRMWPHKIRLELVDFHDGVAKVAAGANFKLRVRAFRGDTEIPVLPDNLEIRFREEGGDVQRKPMTPIGAAASVAAPADEVLREYGYSFTGLLSTVHFDVVPKYQIRLPYPLSAIHFESAGGDLHLHDMVLQVVPNPSLKLSLRCEYPSYMERNPIFIEPGAQPVPVPVGSRLTLSGVASKALESLHIDCPAADRRLAWQRDFSAADLGDNRDVFAFVFEPFPNPPVRGRRSEVRGQTSDLRPPTSDCTLLFTLRDADGIKGRDPIVLNLVAKPDEPPDVKVELVGTREPYITTKGRLPVSGKITDDNGLARAWYDYAIETPEVRGQRSDVRPPTSDLRPPTSPRTGELPLAQWPGHPAEYIVKDAAIEASQLKLAEGQKLTLTVRAADLCDLGAGPNIGSGKTWQLDVVSEDEMLTRLEARELLLRQRFEAIVQEMTETRTLLLKMDFSPPDDSKPVAPKAKSAGAEPGELTAPVEKLSAADLTSRRLERTLQALQNCHKNTLETAEIAAGVDEIRLQLTNNRIDSEERKTRLDANVSRPLHTIVEEMFPVFGKRLEALQPLVGDLAAGPSRRDDALKQADAILARMQEVLSHMMVMEDFNVAVVQRLQKLIERQKELTRRTIKSDQENLGEKE